MSNNLRYLTPLKATAATPAWSPSDKTGMLLWYKADSITGLADGDPVSTWVDSSGSGFSDATQTLALRPTYKTGILNGKPGVLFNGTSQYMTMGTSSTGLAEGTGDCLIAVIQQQDKGVGSQYHTLMYLSTNTAASAGGGKRKIRNMLVIEDDATYKTAWTCFNDTIPPATGVRHDGVSLTSAGALTINYNGGAVSTSGSYSFYKNSVAQTPLSASGTGATDGTNGNKIGAWEGPTHYFKGYIFELIAYNSEMSAGDLTNLATYLSTKYGI